MICFLYQEKEGDIPPTQTKIYEEFTKCIILRKQKRKNNKAKIISLEDLKEDKAYFKDLCHLAYDMTIKNKQAVCGEELDFLEHIDFNDLSSLGLVTNDRIAKLSGHYKIYSFLHLTFQEYLAAWYIAHLDDKEEQMEIIRLYAEKGHMRMVWKFYCGMVEFGGQTSQIEQIMPIKSNYGKFILHGIQCAFESQQTTAYDHLFKNGLFQGSGLANKILTPADLTALGSVISIAFHPIRNILISPLTDDSLKALINEISIDKLKNLETWDLACGNVSSDGVTVLASALKSCCRLEKLKLSQNVIGPDGAIALSNELKSCDRLKELDLSCNNIGLNGTKALSSVIMCDRLEELNLSNNNIGLEGAQVLASMVSSCKNMKVLDISWNNIGPDGVRALADALPFYDSLDTLYLMGNNIGPDEAHAIAGALKSCNKLGWLDVSDNNIGSHGAQALAGVLKFCGKLFYLGLKKNNIGSDGAQALAGALQYCDQLEKLDLSENNIGSDGAQALASALQYCDKLETLYLSDNNIGLDDAQALADAFQSHNEHRRLGPIRIPHPSLSNNPLVLSKDSIHMEIGHEFRSVNSRMAMYCDKLETQELSDNTIGSCTAQAQACALQYYDQLKTLELSDNNIGSDSAHALAGALQYYDQLKTLELSDNNIGSDAAQAPVDAFQSHNKHKRLQLRGIDEEFESMNLRMDVDDDSSCTSPHSSEDSLKLLI